MRSLFKQWRLVSQHKWPTMCSKCAIMYPQCELYRHDFFVGYYCSPCVGESRKRYGVIYE